MLSTLFATPIELGQIKPVTDAYSKDSDTQNGALNNIELFISNIIGFLTVLAAVFFIIYFFMAAFKWITSGSDAGAAGKARQQMLNGVVGLIIIIAAYGILGLIGSILGLDLLNVGDQIEKLIPV